MSRVLLFLSIFLFACTKPVTTNLSLDNSVTKKNISIDKVENHPVTNICNANITFVTPVTTKKQQSKLSSSVSLAITQALAQQKKSGINIATNVICHQLTGANYTGSEQEWSNFLANAVTGLKKSGGQKMQLVLVSGVDRVFMKDIPHKEYKFFGTFGKNRQIIFNLAILDKEHNTVYTLSVSGSRHLEKLVNDEFKRVVDSFELLTNKP